MSTGVVTGFSHVAIVVTDLDLARRFYCDLLGLVELPRPDLGVPGMWLRVGDLQLHFIENDTMPVPGPGFPHLALHVSEDRFDAVVDSLRAHDVRFLGDPSTRMDFGVPVRAVFVLDPAGNTIELTDVGPLRS